MNKSVKVCIASLTLLFMLAFGLAASAGAQEANTPAANAEIVKALDNAMDPGEGQKKLDFMVGTFDVKIRVWLEPTQPAIESQAVSVHTWVLGHRYVQTMLSGFIMGEAFNAIGYVGYDNVAKKYVASEMDSGSTGMEWYSGAIAPDGKSAKLTTTIYGGITDKPIKVEMRLTMDPEGDHVTQLWQADASGKMYKTIELQYKRKK